MSYKNIPEELQRLNQWIVWRYEEGGAKPTKVPYDPKTNNLANVNDFRTWSSFEVAIKEVKKYSGIGFVFTNNDPYTFIDLDDTKGDALAANRQVTIFKELNSYAEISPSGKGLHIIVRGNVPSGRRRSFIEIYSSQRYATFTGNLYNNNPIRDCQDQLLQLWQQMGESGIQNIVYKGDDKEKYTDVEIIDQAANAVNGEKFKQLYLGQWENSYRSQSEADFAFIDIISFYTQNRNQISRIFHTSALGKRPKAQRQDYLSWMINKSFDQMLPPIDFDGFKNAIQDKLAEISNPNIARVAQLVEPTAHNRSNVGSNPTTRTILPPGLLGEIAKFIYDAAPRQVPEIALAGAIGLLTGICGRAYNILGTGLNQYILLLADTGTGKESMALGMNKIMNAVALQVPTALRFMGPAEIASGQALIKHLSKCQCFVSVLGEFGLRIKVMSSFNASTGELNLRRQLLDLYNKSGYGQTVYPTIYSDKEKNIEAIISPSFTLLGESTPSKFYENLDEDMIAEGLLPRFLLIEYTGKRPPLNKNAMNVNPPFSLIDKFASLIANVETIMHNRKVLDVKCDPKAQKMLDEFDEYADNLINLTDKDIYKHLWTRSHMKVLKTSALIAVGVNMIEPLITKEYVQWSIDLVEYDIKALSRKFEAGEIGLNTNESRQLSDMGRILKEYIMHDYEKIVIYGDCKLMYDKKVIPYSYISRRLINTASFRNDRMGATNAMKRTLQMMIDRDTIREVGKQQLTDWFGTYQRAFVIKDMELLGPILYIV